ncbi:MAG: hypothetical protein B7Z40_22170 [Bosea sp. 12-68-7]|nr:MAG: hypothetical protein B7Z40_22170 [Bosea sp. 12-68-7]OYW97373.1 MAG: hypothetical protein B7Z14_17890 [Bosea sp. 32-68-6]
MLIPVTPMSRAPRLCGFVLTSLTIATVALAQQDGRQGRVTLPTGTPGLTLAIAAEDKARLTRPSEPRRVRIDCSAESCDTPPKTGGAADAGATSVDGCGAAPAALDRNGRVIRRICQIF